MATWIFQCNPDDFDVDGYLSLAPRRITWQVNQSWNQIAPDDQVFLWRAQGRGHRGEAGIVAECLVDTPVREMEEEAESRPFWRGVTDFGPRRRVWLRIVRIADESQFLSRPRLAADPVLSGLGPIAFGQATNFRVKPEEIGPLNAMWQQMVQPPSAEAIRRELDRATAQLEQKSLQDVLDEYARRRNGNEGVPQQTRVSVIVFERDPYVRAIARKRAGFKCEIPDCGSKAFTTASGEIYCEVHHIAPLASGGPDTPENAACVCAQHHRELHVGERREELRQMLRRIRENGR